MPDTCTFDDFCASLSFARQRVSAIEQQMHDTFVKAYLSFVSKREPFSSGTISVGESRVDFPALGFGFACCTAGNDVVIGLEGETIVGLRFHGSHITIDGEVREIMFNPHSYCTFAAHSSKEDAGRWLAQTCPAPVCVDGNPGG